MNKQNVMEYATLGNTGLLVSKLCFGTMTFGDGRGLFKGISAIGQAGADELVKTSIDGGINFFVRRRITRRERAKGFSAITEKPQHHA
jgi:predicted aldo/keto reductase-like oxidoreductase